MPAFLSIIIIFAALLGFLVLFTFAASTLEDIGKDIKRNRELEEEKIKELREMSRLLNEKKKEREEK